MRKAQQATQSVRIALLMAHSTADATCYPLALHEAGRYLRGKPLLTVGPHRQLAMVFPPSVLPLIAVSPASKGVSEMLLAEALVLPRKASC